MRTYLLGFIFLGLTFLPFSTVAQITGATSVSVGQTVQYRIGGTRIILEGCPYWSLSGNGTIEYEDARTATINWTAAGTSTIWFSDDCAGIFSSLSVTILGPACTAATPNTTFGYSVNTCGKKLISYTGAPPTGETWYWQDSSTGTSIANSTTTYQAGASGTYYLRSYANCGTWSGALATTAIVYNPVPTEVTTTTSRTICGSGSANLAAVPGSNGTTVRWYSAQSGGSLVFTGTTFPTPSLSTTTNYYVSSYNATTFCESSISATPVVATVSPVPPAPVPSGATYTICGSGSTTITAYPPGGGMLMWYATPTGGGMLTSPNPFYTTPILTTTTTYYVEQYSYGCPSASRLAVVVTVAPIPSTPTVPNVQISYGTSASLSGTPGANANNLKWYSQSTGGSALYTGTTYPTPNLNANTTYYVSSFNGVSACESSRIPVVVTVHNLNWVENIAYGSDGLPISDTRAYQDGFGTTIQSQSIDFVSGKVWATQPIFDFQNNPAASTLPAPLPGSAFVYKNDFVQNSSDQIYSANDFDKPVVSGLAGELNNPKPVGNAAGTLGWYYSSQNNLEPATPTTQFPYSRSYTPPGPNPTTSKSAGVGENNKMGSNHEVSSQKTIFAASELNHYYQLRTLHIIPDSPMPTGNVGYKVVSTDPNQKQATLYTDADGRSLASVTDGKWSYTYYNDVGQVIASIAPNGVIIGVPSAPKFVTYYKYDHLGRLIETTSPDEGMSQFVYSTDGKIRFSQNQLQREANPQRFSYTNYDYLGRLIESGEYEVSGTTPFVFEPHTISTPAPRSILRFVDITEPVPMGDPDASFTTWPVGDARCKETNFIQYDAPASDYPTDALHTSQNYLIGQVARTKNENTTTWYSYDEFGQLTSMKQALPFSQQQSVTWRNFINTSQSGVTLSKTSGGENWNAGAFSLQNIPANTNGFIEFSAGETTSYKMMGLSASDANESYSTINYAFYPEYGGDLLIYENGAYIGRITRYTTDDRLRIEREGNTIYYKKNGLVIYTSLTPSTTALYGDCSLYSSVSSFNNIVLYSTPSLSATVKTIDYTYDYFGNVLKVAYQQGQPDAFYHHYDYDKNSRLTVASTSLDGTTKTVRAKYFYYLHGPLKRVELGNNIQGIDYVYNIDGSLKFINHPDPTKDIGKDGISGTNAGFQPDVFGMALDYNANDYVPAGYADAGSFSLPGYQDQFGGAVKSIRWHSPTDSHVPRGYAFNYDNRYQLTNADFGSVTGTSSYGLNINTVSGTPNFQQYKEAVTNYDNNGNIYALTRNGKTGNSLANYNYTYTTSTNKLASVTNGGNAMLNYQYNSIGQLTQQTEGTNTMKISYTAYGLTKEIRDGANKLKASYAYDDRGNRVKKTIYNSSEAVQNITYYVSDAAGNTLATYEQDVAGAGSMYLTEVPIYAAGRVGIYKPLTNYSIYEVNDHLGNVRGVVGNPEPFTYTATMEDNGQPVFSNPRVQEMAYFKNLFATANTAPYMNRTAPSTAVPAPNTSSYTYWKSGFPGITPDLKSIGPAIGITVQPGDKLDMEAYVKFETKPSYSRSSIAGSMATLLANSFVNTAVGLETVAQASQVFNNGLASALSATGIGNGNETNTGRPHAYLYYLLYDRNFNFVTAGWKRVSATSPPGFAPGAEITSVHERVSIPQITITDPGYVYIYVANESEDTRVWWDDLKVTHLRSNIVAGADYYPFGLPMENREITREDYRYGYQGQFAEKDKETGWNAFELRMYDARIGRTLSPDPYGQFASPYAWVGNNPVSGTDPDGGWCTTCLAQLGQSIQNMMGTMLDAVTVTASRSVVSGAVASGIGNVILRDGFKTWTNQGLMIEPNFPSFQQSSPRQEQWSNYNANLSTPGLSSMPSPSTSLSGSISSYLPSAETLQTGLGVAGWIPGVQTIAGIAEAGVALYRGEYLGATLALAGAVPVVGYLAKFAKSSRFLLQAHHVIPRAVIRNFNLNSVTGFAADGLKNIKRLPFPFHASHYQYNLYVTRELEKLGGNINLPALTKLQNQLKVEIRNAWRIHKQGGGNLNDYFRTLN